MDNQGEKVFRLRIGVGWLEKAALASNLVAILNYNTLLLSGSQLPIYLQSGSLSILFTTSFARKARTLNIVNIQIVSSLNNIQSMGTSGYHMAV